MKQERDEYMESIEQYQLQCRQLSQRLETITRQVANLEDKTIPPGAALVPSAPAKVSAEEIDQVEMAWVEKCVVS